MKNCRKTGAPILNPKFIFGAVSSTIIIRIPEMTVTEQILQAITLLNCIREVFGSILGRTRNIFTEVIHGSPQSFMEKSRIKCF
jgi:hypothetical protein